MPAPACMLHRNVYKPIMYYDLHMITCITVCSSLVNYLQPTSYLLVVAELIQREGTPVLSQQDSIGRFFSTGSGSSLHYSPSTLEKC